MLKKIFMIAVTDREESLNRKYTNTILDLLTTKSPFMDEYKIDIHYRLHVENLHQSIGDALTNGIYEGFIILLDCLQGEVCNPNVMFELGAIFYLNRPFVVISSHQKESFPFDINDLNIINVPREIIDYIKDCHDNDKTINAQKYFYFEHVGEKKYAIVEDFLNKVFYQYEISIKAKKKREEEIIDIKNILLGINEIKELVSNTAEYIDGEGPAFNALQEAVSHAEFSLRTTRFANESIVKEDSIVEQQKFMESLYKMSDKLKDRFDRIICNNHPIKWNDIYNILFYGGNGAKVYVRKHDFSIHFEIVVIDEKIGFIHFYQADSEKKGGKSGKEVERIKSTLKIQGSSICQKLANIFDRLHHRDFLNTSPVDPSRTLLGIPVQDNEWQELYADYGCFVVDMSIPEHSQFAKNSDRRNYIINMFKQAFVKWYIGDFHDKVIMAAGIALVEGNGEFIEKMKTEGKLKPDEYKEAKKMYEDNQKG